MNFNKVFLGGNLTRDPELSYTPNQTAVVNFGMAVNRRWKGQDGNDRDEPCFVDLVMFGKRAEVVKKYCAKGNPLFVEGRLTFDSWEAQDGSKRNRLKVTVENFEFVGGSLDQMQDKPQRQSSAPPPPGERDEVDDFLAGD